MPTADKQLTNAELEEVARAINARAQDPTDPCPNCGKVHSEVVGSVGRIRFAFLGSTPQSYISTVSTVCLQCGFVRSFAMKQLGLSFDEDTLVTEEVNDG